MKQSYLLAEIPSVYFKDITQLFQDRHYSPLIGRAALDSGLIYNLRHFGKFVPAYLENGQRDYARDKPLDTTMELLLKFFPSPAGPLSPTSEAQDNYGKYATIQDIADMLNFAKKMRSLIENDFHSSPLETLIGNIEGKQPQNVMDIYNEFQQLGLLTRLIDQSIRTEYNSQNTGINIRTYNSLKETTPVGPFKEWLKTMHAQLSSSTLYPQYTTEMIILSFFVHRFNSQNDLNILLSLLGSNIVYAHAQLNPHNIWTKEAILAQTNQEDEDFLYITSYYDWDTFPPIPYKEGTDPINNGNCFFISYNRGLKELNLTDDTFPDCHETALRHFLNIMFYNSILKIFQIPDKIKNVAMRNFYTLQTPLHVNDGSSEMRGQWNLVVGGIPSIRYDYDFANEKHNGLSPGFCNFIKVLRYLLDYRWDAPLPQEESEIILELEALIQYLNPTIKNIKISIKDFDDSGETFLDEQEFYGIARIDIQNQQDQNFSFSLYQASNHGDIRNITFSTLKGFPRQYDSNPKDPIFSLIDAQNSKQGLFKLFANGQFDGERKSVARALFFRNDIQKQHIPIIQRIIKTNLNNPEVSYEIFQILKILEEKNLWIEDYTFTFAHRLIDDEFWLDLWEKYPQRMQQSWLTCDDVYLTIDRFKNAGPPNFEILHKLVVDYELETLDLKDALKLEELEVSQYSSIGTLRLPQYGALKSVSFFGHIGPIDMQNCLKVSTIKTDLTCTHIDSLVLPNSRNLKYLDLSGSFQDIDISHIPNLSHFSLFPSNSVNINLVLTCAQEALLPLDIRSFCIIRYNPIGIEK